MAMEIAAYREPAVPTRKRARATTCQAFDAPNKTEFFAVGKMSGPERETLRERFHSELVAVRGLLQKAAAAPPPSSPSSAPQGKVCPRFLAAVDPPAKRRKASPPPVVGRAEAPKKMTPADREQLAADLAELSGELPAHIVQRLQKLSRGCRGGEIVIDIHAVDGAALVELKMQLEKFAEERNPSPQEHKDGKMVEDEEKDVDIYGGVSPIAIAPSPLQLSAEEDEYVDICGDASPVAMPRNLGEDEISGSPSSSSDSESDSGNGSSGSDCGDSDSDSDSDSDESVSPAPAGRPATPPITELIAHGKESLERRRQEERSRAREKAHQELLEMERTAMSSETIHPTVLQRLGIARDQYMVSPASFLRRLGLFLKADDDDSEGVEEDLEEGELWL